jgi:cytochrome c
MDNRNVTRSGLPGCLLAMLPLACASASGSASAAEPPPIAREALVGANYRQGMVAFQTRCSACHSLADGGTNLVGPNLYGVFRRKAGGRVDFSYSDALESAGFDWTPERLAAWLANPQGYLRGTTMMLPEPVPEADRVALLSYLMIETGAADWPRPTMPRAAAAAGAGADAPLSVRFPSFWNHLMTNTTRYKVQGPAGELRFDAYFNPNGTVTTNLDGLQGFWRETPGEQFCYALQGLPNEMRQLIECFPIVAMSIPRFREELWTTQPAPGFKLTGGIVAGRPEWSRR